tara:strand:- start:1928 stop:2206 length:279 start_codon:yes stop_codon:yes gene_type:complete
MRGEKTPNTKLDGGNPMTLTEDSCAVSAKNLAVGMKIRLRIARTNWVTITEISDVPPSFVRIDYVDSSGYEGWFMSGNEARQQVLSSSQIPA